MIFEIIEPKVFVLNNIYCLFGTLKTKEKSAPKID
jgi:hypothetical protein